MEINADVLKAYDKASANKHAAKVHMPENAPYNRNPERDVKSNGSLVKRASEPSLV